MTVVVTGAQWGDEGKGKMVDYFARDADLVVRFSGGANAGHSIRVGKKHFALHLVPAGIIYPGKTVVLGSGMVIDPEALFQEINELKAVGINFENRIYISDRAHLILDDYKKEDVRIDKARPRPIGTTGRGIGVAFSKKVQRDGVRVADLWDPVIWDSLGESRREYLQKYKELLSPMVINLYRFMMEKKDKRILFEGAQGTLLDVDHGTYPYVSSSISTSNGAAAGSGMGPRHIDKCLGIFKAYQTRVGNGPFPTEITDEQEAHRIRELGHEYGVTTGRPRRIGVLDMIALRYAAWLNSLDGLILSHLNLFDGFEEIRICVSYKLDGEVIDYFPTTVMELEKVVPVIKTFPGWKGSVSRARSFDELPGEAMEILHYIEEYTSVKIVGLSVGPLRDETFMSEDVWTQ